MKITKDVIERGILTKNNTMRMGSNSYHFLKCSNCGDDYLGIKNSQFCTNKCKIQSLRNSGLWKTGHSNKFSYDYVKGYIEKEGYALLSKSYINSHEKLKIECPNGHIYYVRFYSFKQGQRCPICVNRERGSKNKLSFSFVKEYIEKEGYKLLSDKYKHSKIYLDVKCPEGHEYEVRWSNFKIGQRCKICRYKEMSERNKHSYDYVKRKFKKEGYTLLSKEYINSKSFLSIKCPEGHEYKIEYARFRDGKRCTECERINRRQKFHQHIKEQMEKERYVLLSKTYKGNKKRLKVKCPEGHEYKINWNNWSTGYRCPICWSMSTSSKPENEVFEYIDNIITEKIIRNDRTQIFNSMTGKNLELDIWIPSLNKAIEFNGKYWHSLPYVEYKDRIKSNQCKDIGIDLLIIEEQDWIDKKDDCLKKLRSHLKGE